MASGSREGEIRRSCKVCQGLVHLPLSPVNEAAQAWPRSSSNGPWTPIAFTPWGGGVICSRRPARQVLNLSGGSPDKRGYDSCQRERMTPPPLGIFGRVWCGIRVLSSNFAGLLDPPLAKARTPRVFSLARPAAVPCVYRFVSQLDHEVATEGVPPCFARILSRGPTKMRRSE